MKFDQVQHIRSIAVVGATGMVGREFVDILNEHQIRIPELKLLASENSAGETVDYLGKEVEVEELDIHSFDGVEVAFFSVPNNVTRTFVPRAIEAGCLVVDDSSTYRMDPAVPLVVPQINAAVLRSFTGQLMATPNCTTTPLAMVLKPLHDKFELKRVVVSTYQAVSGAGTAAFEELSEQTAGLLNGMEKEPVVFPHRIAFNCLPMIGSLTENGNTEEEEKVVKELRKILELPELKVSATAVRVPTFIGHGLSVNAEFEKPISTVEEIREMLDGFSGVKVLDNPTGHIYPTNAECAGADHTFVGRIRVDNSVKSGINFWAITDNIRKGAALNVLETLEALYNYRRMS